jgi:hypothetical protein
LCHGRIERAAVGEGGEEDEEKKTGACGVDS